MINSGVELDLPRTNDCVLVEHNKITYITKPYVPVVILPIKDNNRILEQGLKKKNSWNKCRSDITTQPTNNNLDHKIEKYDIIRKF